MNYTKAQKICFDALCNGRNIRRFDLDEKRVFVTPDGYRGFIFPKVGCNFNLEKIADFKGFPIEETIKPENELTLTLDVRLSDNRREMYCRLKGNGKSTFVNKKFLECFQNPKFFQPENKNAMIVVTESKTNEPVGIILPVRANWDDGSYYSEDMKGGAKA